MQTRDFYFDLPQSLIAQYPLKERSKAKMLVYHKGKIFHSEVNKLPNFLQAGDLLVFNDSKVIKARLFGTKETQGKVEIFLDRIISSCLFLAHIRASKAPKDGSFIYLTDKTAIKIEQKIADLYLCSVKTSIYPILEMQGKTPLPPYIQREASAEDELRYQTIYAKHQGSVAAPTAGLHFEEKLLALLSSLGVEFGFTTLHVGAGTFKPVRTHNIADHKMHAEFFSISEELCSKVNKAKKEKRRVIAVGTTALRALESAAKDTKLTPLSQDTDIFITPGYKFKIVDGLMTNFHLPQSTLLMLVAAFVGHATWRKIYQAAIEEQYRFFSYGDASLLL
ncbi:MAG: tRNA preQ1(34) S-adenosylmethionine ribosyltransferase-isomerase QueA [Legionellales bacterium RIFCSPHIGHO2_12_FULL_37_14]|nr:MAG: tRNA preQ1(34) S-adenosylmethionine ribosyltransferase-isomerase QueA [Legionellales bacterium RIFCSPHIGHO2_12_FULL_37_14]